MSLTAEEQQLCFKNYWQKIESATEYNPTKFLRDYLTIKQQLQRPVRLSNIYFEWKKYMDGRDRKQERVRRWNMAGINNKVKEPKLETANLWQKIRHIGIKNWK